MAVKCRSCSGYIFLKRAVMKNGESVDLDTAKSEYQTLQAVYQKFPHGDGYETPEPLNLCTRSGILSMTYFPGHSLHHHLHKRRDGAWESHVSRAAEWLRKFHDITTGNEVFLDTADKVSFLEQRLPNEMRGVQYISDAIAILDERAGYFRRMPFRSARLHGDFKPENILVNTRSVAGIDFGFQTSNSIVFDIGPFFNHVVLDSRLDILLGRSGWINRMERIFLDAYGDIDAGEMAALAWVRLYFMLSYGLTFRDRSTIHLAASRVVFAPLIRSLTKNVLQLAV